jgi:gliding motility-associated-like protein
MKRIDKTPSSVFLCDLSDSVVTFFIKHIFSLLFFLYSLPSSSPAQPLGNGRDGSPQISGIVNLYTPVLNDLERCDKKISVKNSIGFSPGDLVLVIQMQGAVIDNSNTPGYGTITDYAGAGNFEYALVDSIENGNIIILKFPLLGNFSASGKTQLLRIPQYADPVISSTLTCKSWDGETGGILAIDATGSITLNATINVSGKGFRGGRKMKGGHFFAFSHDYVGESYNPDWFSLKGEGIAFDGIFPFTSGRGAPANGGGGGNIHTAGGGGGGNSGCGGKGGWGYPVDTLGNQYNTRGLGGYALYYGNKIFMGGGGGAGHEHFGNGTDGANGGGMVIITAAQIKGNSKLIMANGNSSAGSGAYGDGAGGAGAGGTIFLSANNINDTLYLSAKGGDGGSSILKGFGPGGGGGGGTILFSSPGLATNIAVLSLSGGTGGLAGGNFYGAEAGCAGEIINNFKTSFNNYYAGVHADFTFLPSYLSAQNSSITFTNLSAGATGYQWDFGDETNEYTANPVHTYYDQKNYTVRLIASDSVCSDTATALITSEFIPNVFTPNGDGENDLFYFSSLEPVSEAELRIFNRWGEMVFSKYARGKTGELKWNGARLGKPVPEGNYFFIIEYSTGTGEKKSRNGCITLVR